MNAYKTYFSKFDSLKVQHSLLEDDLHACEHWLWKPVVSYTSRYSVVKMKLPTKLKLGSFSHKNKCFLYVTNSLYFLAYFGVW